MATANMGMTLPVVGVTADSTGEQNVVDNFGILDVHDHTSGKGSQVPSAGININADLSFAGYRPYNVKAVTFSSQSSSLTAATNKPCVYVLNGELVYIDSSSNAVSITSGGSVAGTSGSIGGLVSPASAAFASSKFTWKSDTTIYAKMDFADIQLFQQSAGITNGVTLKSPAALAASYTITMPGAAPGSTQYVSMDSGGTLATVSADTIAAAMTSTGANAIRAVSTRSTGTSVSAGGVAISTSCGNFSTTSASLVDITNLSVTIVTSGRPVYVGLISDATVNDSFFGVEGSATGALAEIVILRDATVVSRQATSITSPSGSIASLAPSSSVNCIDAVGAGTYTYKAQLLSTSDTARCAYSKLIAYEL